MKCFALLLSVSVLFVGCVNQYRDTTLYQRSGRAKPIVAVMPVLDSSSSPSYGWDIAHELTEEIRQRVHDSSRLYLLREGGDMAVAAKLNEPNPVELDASVTSDLGAAEFVVVTELLDQTEVRYGLHPDKPALKETSGQLTMALRVRVLDVRDGHPTVILQEVISQEFPIACPYLQTDYSRDHWGTSAYSRTPLGMAHSRVVREVVSRVEGYVAAKKG